MMRVLLLLGCLLGVLAAGCAKTEEVAAPPAESTEAAPKTEGS